MGGRGTFASGVNVEFTYETKDKIYDAKILSGLDNLHHGLPEESHSPNSKYIRLNTDGSVRTLRIFGPDRYPILEIGYHAERSLDSSRKNVLHYHTFESKDIASRSRAKIMTKELYNKYKKYLRGVKFND